MKRDIPQLPVVKDRSPRFPRIAAGYFHFGIRYSTMGFETQLQLSFTFSLVHRQMTTQSPLEIRP